MTASTGRNTSFPIPTDDYDAFDPESEDFEPIAKERPCKPCYGSGEDEVGADCLACDGYGTIEY